LGTFNRSLKWGQKKGNSLGNVQQTSYLEHGKS
jgi:hypothetical protein